MRFKIFFCILLIIIMNTSANSKETIISYYEIKGIFKMQLGKNIIEYDENGREKREMEYTSPWGILILGTITIYEYPDTNTKIEYFNSGGTRGYKMVFKYDDKNNLISLIEYLSDRINIPIKEWEIKYRKYYYEKESDTIYDYNDKNDLLVAKSLFGGLHLIEDLPYDGSGMGIEEFKYVYNDKNQKISVFGKHIKTNEYLEEWKYYYGPNNNLIKKEKYIRNRLSSYYSYKYNEKNLLIKEIAHSLYFNFKENINADDVMHYYTYEYYPDGKLKRKNKHNHMDFKKIEDMKIWSYEEYTYK